MRRARKVICGVFTCLSLFTLSSMGEEKEEAKKKIVEKKKVETETKIDRFRKRVNIHELMEKQIFDHIEFEDATVSDILEYIKKRSKELDPNKGGVNFMYLRTKNELKNKVDPRISISVDQIPLGELIRYICKACKLKYRIEKHAVIIASQKFPMDEMHTKHFKISPATIQKAIEDANK